MGLGLDVKKRLSQWYETTSFFIYLKNYLKLFKRCSNQFVLFFCMHL